ncbi:replicative DNA helicase [Candidatus Sumerlaeota bacterium]|nr:replicative DNA helicase [Candidatus Sumerlaeota bacterium]
MAAPSIPTETRVPPHNLEAERAILGTFYLNDTAVVSVQSLLDAEDFYDPAHQAIFSAVIDLAEAKTPIDPMVLINEMDRRGLLEKVGGPAYLTGLEQYVISPGNVMHHARIVHEKSLLRKLIRTSAEIASQAYAEADEAHSLLTESERRIFEIIKQRQRGGFHAFGDVAQEVYSTVLHRSENRREVTGLATHYRGLDRLTGGFQRSDLIILAARPSMGKTSLALNVAARIAMSERMGPDGKTYHPGVGIFSLEMSAEQVIQRMICTEAKIPMDLVRKNMLDVRQVERFAQTGQEMLDLPIYINDTPGIDPTELRLQAQHLQTRDPNLAFIVVDYLQLMSVKRSRTESRQQEVSEISRSIKGLARDLNVPILALSQLSRGIESRRLHEREPRLSDLRESGAIEQDSDLVVFIHPVLGQDQRTESQGDGARLKPSVAEVELIVAKHRNGPQGRVEMLFRRDFTEFVEKAVVER